MTRDYHKPTKFPSGMFEAFEGGMDPAESSRIAHETARALLSRVRADPDPGVVDRLIRYTDEHGIDTIAELWSHATSRSLPGSLWRIYLLRLLIRQDPEFCGLAYQRGADVLSTADPVIAGAAAPTGPDEIKSLADLILHGVYAGDFTIALERAAAYCRVFSSGCTSLADDIEATEPERASELTKRALRYAQFGRDLGSAARLWSVDSLD